MTIDHIGLYYADVLPVNIYHCLRLVGSLALPLFMYCLVFGFLRTSSTTKYFYRILICALGTQLLIQLTLPMAGQTSLILPLTDCFLLVIAFILLYGFELMLAAIPGDRVGSLRLIEAAADTHSDRFDVRIGSGQDGHLKKPGITIPQISGGGLFFLSILLIFLSLILSIFLPLEKALWGMMLVSVFYVLERIRVRESRLRIALWFILIAVIDFVIIYISTKQWSTNAYSLLAVFLCLFPFLEKKPGRVIQSLFYVYYPLHILILIFLREVLIQ
jgi:hypothetical protein